jgi:hypothetical protein
VHLLGLPVPLAAKAQQHAEELIREFALIAAGEGEAAAEHHAPARLMQLVDSLTSRFAGRNTAADERLAAAIDRGDVRIDDHVLELPPEAADASRALGEMLDEADAYCARGKHLLTLATPPDCLAYRRWYLGQVVSQLAGGTPVAWSDSPEAGAL